MDLFFSLTKGVMMVLEALKYIEWWWATHHSLAYLTCVLDHHKGCGRL